MPGCTRPACPTTHRLSNPLIDVVSNRLSISGGRLPTRRRRRLGDGPNLPVPSIPASQDSVDDCAPWSTCSLSTTRCRTSSAISTRSPSAASIGRCRAEELVSTVGRSFITAPVFQAMAETEWTVPGPTAVERVRHRLHPITVTYMQECWQRRALTLSGQGQASQRQALERLRLSRRIGQHAPCRGHIAARGSIF
jgi:hypothetical protein